LSIFIDHEYQLSILFREQVNRSGEEVYVKGCGSVVGLYEVFDDGARLPQSDASVRVFDGWDSAVGVDGFERLFFEICKVCGPLGV
jgi:hypothetical protein